MKLPSLPTPSAQSIAPARPLIGFADSELLETLVARKGGTNTAGPLGTYPTITIMDEAGHRFGRDTVAKRMVSK
jgi:hypothetical protein